MYKKDPRITQRQAMNMVYLREMISERVPAVRDPRRPPSWRIEVSHPVAAVEAVTDGKLAWKRNMTKACPRTPCW